MLLDSKQKLFASQMAPHFLSNIINYIHGLALGDEENKDKSIYYAAKFSKLMRYIIESTSFEYISLNKEIQMMNDYMDLQILMHKSSLNFNVKIQENINMEDYYIPSMLLQPFIENSIKHFPFANKGLYIDMEIFIKNEQLHIIIKDNGIGINKEKIINERESFSINIIKNRVKLINTLHKKSIWFNLDNIIENNQIIGLMVEYKFPIKNIQHENFYS